MKYTEKELFEFMDSGKPVIVTCDNGHEFKGQCWAYGAIQNEEEDGIAEPSLEVGPGTVIYASEIKSIEILE